MTKTCEICGNSFEAYRSTNRFCRDLECQKTRQKQRWQKWYAKEDSRLKLNEQQRDYRARTRNRADRHWELKSKYGISLEHWEAMLENAGYACEICRQDVDLVYDHCHETGVARGVLCRTCNKGIGSLGDCYATVNRAVQYLQERADGIPSLMDRVFPEDGKPRFEQGRLFSSASGGDSYVTWESTDKRRVQWDPIWSPPLRGRRGMSQG